MRMFFLATNLISPIDTLLVSSSGRGIGEESALLPETTTQAQAYNTKTREYTASVKIFIADLPNKKTNQAETLSFQLKKYYH